jgi:signal transduction histidine kinase
MKSGAHDYIMKDRLARLVPAVERELREAEVRRARARSEAELLQSRQELEARVRQRTADLELAYQTLRQEVAERRRLENELLEIAENERRRIGFDLHDDLGQKLTGLSMLVKVLENRLTAEGHPCAEEARRMSELIMETMQHTHNLARAFSDLDAEGEDLGALLQRLSHSAHVMFGVPCECKVKGALPRFTEETARQFYKIAQEALSNAIKHGRATVVRMELLQDDAAITLRVANDGEPFNQPTSAHGRMGLKIMSYRASIVGARFHITGVPEGGTVVTCTLPRGALKCPEVAETMQT